MINRPELASLKRELAGVQLVIVTKYATISSIKTVYHFGHRMFGENRVDDFLKKEEYFWKEGLRDIKWHFIGKLQSNKIGKLFSFRGPNSIESIDSLKLLRKIIKRAETRDFPLDIFFQVNTGREDQKGGFRNWEQLKEAFDTFRQEKPKNVYLRGLMAIGRKSESKESFQKLLEIRNRLDPSLKLSMGMSGDYKEALKYKTDYVRIGSLIFQDRDNNS